MNCQSFAETISELARERGNQIEATLRANVLDHLNECPECALRLQDQQALTRGLRELSSEMKSLTAPACVEEQVLATFRKTRRWSEVGDQKSEIRSRWIVAVAAALLVMFGIAGLRYYSRRQQPGSLGSADVVAKATESAAPSKGDGEENSNPDVELTEKPQPGVKRKIPRRHQRRFSRDGNADFQVTAKTTNDTKSEVATYFMPLGYAGPINPQDGGQLVRVELPRSAMLSMGLPVNMDRYGERVKADVLLGPDGLARAIRFVQ